MKMPKLLIMLVSGTLFITGLSLLAYDVDEIPPNAILFSKVLSIIPEHVSGITSIEFDDGSWEVKTLSLPATEQGRIAQEQGKYLEQKYRLNMSTMKFDSSDNPELESESQLPPGLDSLKRAVDAVKANNSSAKIISVEFDDQAWEIKAVESQNSNNNPPQIVKIVREYKVNPISYKIISSKLDD